MHGSRRRRVAGWAVVGRDGRWACAVAIVLLVSLTAAAAAGAELPRLGPARNFALTTQQNDRLWLTQLRGRLVVLTFMCTTCDACPGLFARLEALGRTLGETGERRVFFVAVTVDPRRDTATVLRRFARERNLDPVVWVLLTGKLAEVDVVTRWYGVEVRRGESGISHRCLVTLIDGAGSVRARYAADEIGRLSADIRALLIEAGGS